MSIEDMWDTLVMRGVSNQTLTIITAINGYSVETMLDVLYSHTGLRSFDQLED